MSDLHYNWTLKDAVFTKDKGKVFSCFSCGGGSTMGYKLAGFDVIGNNEIDPKMNEVYNVNHKPKFSYLESITTFKDRNDLPKELYDLDILDGSPPCSSFSMAGSREKGWGEEKKFREGQAEQVLDTLFFDFIDLGKELQPKVIIAENVKGLLLGNAIKYVREIYKQFDEAGYYCQHWLLNASTMGVPQRRERVFFICLRKDLASKFLRQTDLFTQNPYLKLEFKEIEIPFKEIKKDNPSRTCKKSEKTYPSWRKWVESCKPGHDFGSIKHKDKLSKMFNCCKVHQEKPIPTILSKFDGAGYFTLTNRHLNLHEMILAGTFPIDFDFCLVPGQTIIGMSVPPLMTAKISEQVYLQWLSKL
jgi:DNA (cytosine-5)-methyltransferase 1